MISRILMISTSREVVPQPAVPIGAAWVAEALHLAGFQVRLLDLCFQDHPLQAVAEALDTFRPEGIGISVRNLDNCDFLSPVSFLPALKEITDFIKRKTDARILIGGAGVSIMPLSVLEYLELDHAVVGEGERAAVLFFGCQDLGSAAAIAGVVARGRGDHPPCSQLPSISVMPRLHGWVDTRKYLKLEPVLPVQGKRGCAKRCLYCTYNKIEGERWRLREPAEVVEEIEVARRQTGAGEFEFVDGIFNQPEGYLEALLEEVLRRGVKVKLRAASLSPKGVTKEQVRLMERAGMGSVVVTPESASDLTLTTLGKDFTEEEVLKASELLAASGVRVLWCFLLGAPREDERSLAGTISFINSRMPKKDAAFITTGIRIYPGTGLHQLALREGVVKASDNLLMPTFYFSSQIKPQQAREYLQKEVLDLSRCIFLSDTRWDSLNAMRRLGTILRIPTPFWRYAGYMNKINRKKRIIARDWSPPAAPGK